MAEYRSRIADRLLKEKLESAGGVLIQGPKWCGKTTTAEQQAQSSTYMNDPEREATNLQLAATMPSALLNGKAPQLVDEWQMVPKLWDAARFLIDHRRSTGQFIFTGSAVPADTEQIAHSGAGRFAWLTMRTMSLWESGGSNGAMSLSSLFEGNAPTACPTADLNLEQMAHLICRGGWPGALSMSERAALEQPFNYLDAVTNTDISRVDGVRRDASFTKRLMRSYARHQGAQVSIATLHQVLISNEKDSFGQETITSYIDALKKIFVVEDMEAWNPNLRSKAAVRTSDTRYFTDPSIATAALGLGPKDLMNDLNTMGLMFETLCVRDLRVFAEALNGHVYHYRDKNGLECDAVIHLRNGAYGLIEIKLGGESLINEGVKTLTKLASIIDTDRMKAPSFLMVLTAVGNFAYRREDGIYVVPISCLKD